MNPALENESAPRVLIVDDEPTVLRSCHRLLTTAGFEVDIAPDGAAAEKMLATRGYDLVITDISMPLKDGIELLRAVRKADAELPVILMTGDPSLNSAIDAIQYGVSRYLVKPVDPVELRDVAIQAVALRRAELRRQRAEIEGEPKPADINNLRAPFDRALESLWMAFHPIMDVHSQDIFAYEALVRTREAMFPAPMSLFKAAEQLDQLYPLGRRIRALVAERLDAMDERLAVLVNLHPLDLNDPELFAPDAPLAAYAKRVVFEITERTSLQSVRDLQEAIVALRARDYRIAIDDLGAGYSGLASFTQLEPDLVKFDMSIVRGVDTSPMKQKLIRSMTALCHELHIRVIAEGVTNVEERDTLVSLGCDYLQGFFFSHPSGTFRSVKWAGEMEE